MYLIQILLPVYDRGGKRLPRTLFKRTERELAQEFGGVTAYVHTPAEGLWRRRTGHLERDDVVVFEVMVRGCNRGRWARYRRQLEAEYRQDVIVIRSLRCTRL
jgi:hypothetical protein